MQKIPDILYKSHEMPTWLIIGGSRGIGMEFVRQLLEKGCRVLVTVRAIDRASTLWTLAGSYPRICHIFTCDVLAESIISNFVNGLAVVPNLKIDHVVICAGVLIYPNRATEASFDEFAFHLHTNTIGPIITAQKLLKTGIGIGSIVFMSSDSSSATRFLERENGYAAYAASKAGLNQALRHMAAELRRAERKTVILAVHPGNVATDLGSGDGQRDVDGILTPQESVSGMIRVIESKKTNDSGTFWTWENKEHPW